MPRLKLSIIVLLITSSLTSQILAESLQVPKDWKGTVIGRSNNNPVQVNESAWGLYQVYPSDGGDAKNYHPLIWNGKSWVAEKNSHGGQPEVNVSDPENLVFSVRGPWSGNPYHKTAAMSFVAPKTGNYRVTGDLHFKAWTGKTGYLVRFYKKDKNDGIEVIKRYELSDDAHQSIQNLECQLEKGESILFHPTVQIHHSAGTLKLKNFRVQAVEDSSSTTNNVHSTGSVLPKGELKEVSTLSGFPGFPKSLFNSNSPGLINVKSAPFFAKGDGVSDDTLAIQKAIESTNEGIIYLPAGTYLVSDTLEWRTEKSHAWPYRSLHGDGPDRTIIRLKDRLESFGDPKAPKPLIHTRGQGIGGQSEGSQAFTNSLYQLTLHMGQNNPGAVGIRWRVANEGTLSDVHFIAPEGSGHTGVENAGESCGYMTDCVIDGFDYGMRGLHAYANIVADGLHLKNQKVCGIMVHQAVWDLNMLVAELKVPVIIAQQGLSRVTLQNGVFKGQTGATVAIHDQNATGRAKISLSQITSFGYPTLIKVDSDPKEDVITATDKDYHLQRWSSQPFKGPSPSDFELVPKRAPSYWTNASEKWASADDFIQDRSSPDAAKAIQAAIDSGAEIVCLPTQSYVLFRPIIVRGKVRKLLGMRSSLTAEGLGDQPSIIIRDIEGPDVSIEMFNRGPGRIFIDTPKTVTIRDGYGSVYHSDKAKEIFIENFCGDAEFVNVKAYLRQFNPEGVSPNGHRLLADGSDVWVLGMKTEGTDTLATAKNGAHLDISSLIYWPTQGKPGMTPGFVVENAYLRAVGTTRPDIRWKYDHWILHVDGEHAKSHDFKEVGQFVNVGCKAQ